MSTPTAKIAFAVLCLLGILAVGIGALLEISRKRQGNTVVTPVQFKLRMISAVIWMIVLGSLFYAVVFLWPQRGLGMETERQARQFLSVVSGSFLLIAVALGLLVYDLWRLAREGRVHEARFNQQLIALAHAEVERAAKGGPPVEQQGGGATSPLSTDDRAE